MGAIFHTPRKMTPAIQAGLFYARKRNKLNTGVVNSTVEPAWATVFFPSNPVNLDTVTINGTVITFVTGTPSGAQVKIAGTLALTVAALLAYLGINPIAGAVVSGGGESLLVQSAKPADTSVTLAASAATVSSANLVPQTVNARLNANSIPVLP